MKAGRILDELWNSAPESGEEFGPRLLKGIPEAAVSYLQHSILPGTALASAVKLRMRGSIRLGSWLPFSATQVLRADGQMIWRARVRKMGLPLTGFDSLVDGEGRMLWKLLGLVPVVRESGRDVTLSAAGRVRTEMIWLPSVHLLKDAGLSSGDPGSFTYILPVCGDSSPVRVSVDERGCPLTVSMERWGNVKDTGYARHPFGGIVGGEETFGGYTIPSAVRVGWSLVDGRFRDDGEFFRAVIEEAVFR